MDHAVEIEKHPKIAEAQSVLIFVVHKRLDVAAIRHVRKLVTFLPHDLAVRGLQFAQLFGSFLVYSTRFAVFIISYLLVFSRNT